MADSASGGGASGGSAQMRDGEQYYVISVAAELTGMHAQT